jgi:hypothetical protein
MSTSTTETTASALYDEIESDLIAAMLIATFLSRALDSMSDLDKKEAEGAGRVVDTIYDLLNGIKDKCLNATPGPSLVSD